MTIPITSHAELSSVLTYIIDQYQMNISLVDFFLHIQFMLNRWCPDGRITDVQIKLTDEGPTVVLKIIPSPIPLLPEDNCFIEIHINHSAPKSMGVCRFLKKHH